MNDGFALALLALALLWLVLEIDAAKDFEDDGHGN